MSEIHASNYNPIVAAPFVAKANTCTKVVFFVLTAMVIGGAAGAASHYFLGVASPGAAWACGGISFLSVVSLLVLSLRKTSPYDHMLKLVDERKIEAAWDLYLDTAYTEANGQPCLPNENGRKPHGNYLYAHNYTHLPPEALLKAAVDFWIANKIRITSKMSPKSMEDCAIAYESFRTSCFEKEEVWSCFSGLQIHLVNIAQKHASFGLGIMTSSAGDIILDDHHRIYIFNAAFDALLQAIQSNKFTDAHFEYLANFLLTYQLLMIDQFFEKIKSIGKALNAKRELYPKDSAQYSQYTAYIHMFDLVEGKLYFQGMYPMKNRVSAYLKIEKIDVALVERVYKTDWVQKIARKIPQEKYSENVLKGFLYLSMIPKNSRNWYPTQMMLGYVWMECENFQKASRYFLRVAEIPSVLDEEATKMASTCLLARMKHNDNWMYILREDMDKQRRAGKEVRTLSPDECIKNITSLKTMLERKRGSLSASSSSSQV